MLPPPVEQSAARFEPLVADGLVVADEDGYEVTQTGRWFLRNIAMVLDAHLPQQLADARPIFSRTV